MIDNHVSGCVVLFYNSKMETLEEGQGRWSRVRGCGDFFRWRRTKREQSKRLGAQIDLPLRTGAVNPFKRPRPREQKLYFY